MNLAIIPARANSKRLPGKCKRDFFGKPIIQYSIDLAKQLKEMDFVRHIVVASDDKEILAMEDKEVNFIDRLPENADDDAPMFAVLAEMTDCMEEQIKGRYENILCIYPCAPLIRLQRIAETYHILTEGKYDGVVPMQSVAEMTEAGNYFWVKRDTVMKGLRQPQSPYYYYMPDHEVQDINTQSDWDICERKYARMYGGAFSPERDRDVGGSLPPASKIEGER